MKKEIIKQLTIKQRLLRGDRFNLLERREHVKHYAGEPPKLSRQ